MELYFTPDYIGEIEVLKKLVCLQQDIHGLLESHGQRVPISNIFLTSYDAREILLPGKQSYKILVHFEIVTYVPNISEEIVSTSHIIPPARRLLSMQTNPAGGKRRNPKLQRVFPAGFISPLSKRLPKSYLRGDLSTGAAQNRQNNKSQKLSRHLLQESRSYLSQELLQLSNILMEFSDGDVTVENETEEDVDITRAAIAELVGSILVYGSSQQDLENMVNAELSSISTCPNLPAPSVSVNRETGQVMSPCAVIPGERPCPPHGYCPWRAVPKEGGRSTSHQPRRVLEVAERNSEPTECS